MPTPRLARIADGLAAGLIGLAFVVDLSGGFRVGRGWWRISARDPVQLLLLAAGVLLARHVLVRHPSLRERLAARWPVPSSRRFGPAPRRHVALAFAAMTCLTTWLLWDQVSQLTGVADRGDPLFSMWRLAWVAHQLPAGPRHLFDANIFFNAPGTFAYSDATLLPGIVAAPLIWAGMPVAVVHGLLYVASFLLAGVSMTMLARAVTGQLAPSLVSGALFAFLPYRFATYGHLEMQGCFLMPLALLWLLRSLDSDQWRAGAWLGLVVALQCLWSLYLGAFLAVGLIAAAALWWVCGQRVRAAPMAAAAVVAAVILVPYSWPYWRAQQAVGDRGQNEVRTGSATVADYGRINEANRLYGPYSPQNVSAERQLFPGAAPLLLSAIALIPPAGPVAAVSAAGALVSIDASFGLDGLAFRTLYERVPGFRAFRVPARFGMVTGLFLSLLAAIGLARLGSQWRLRLWTRPIAIGLAGLALFEIRPRLQLTLISTAPPPIYAALARDAGAPIVDLPLFDTDTPYWMEPSYLYASTFHWHPLLNGYSGFAPLHYATLQQASREMPSDRAIAVFRDAGARYLVVHEEYYRPGRYREIVTALDRRRDLQLIDTSQAPDGESRLYKLL